VSLRPAYIVVINETGWGRDMWRARFERMGELVETGLIGFGVLWVAWMLALA
jgi:hypothetical protein